MPYIHRLLALTLTTASLSLITGCNNQHPSDDAAPVPSTPPNSDIARNRPPQRTVGDLPSANRAPRPTPRPR